VRRVKFATPGSAGIFVDAIPFFAGAPKKQAGRMPAFPGGFDGDALQPRIVAVAQPSRSDPNKPP